MGSISILSVTLSFVVQMTNNVRMLHDMFTSWYCTICKGYICNELLIICWKRDIKEWLITKECDTVCYKYVISTDKLVVQVLFYRSTWSRLCNCWIKYNILW